jgi:hypothetical protein
VEGYLNYLNVSNRRITPNISPYLSCHFGHENMRGRKAKRDKTQQSGGGVSADAKLLRKKHRQTRLSFHKAHPTPQPFAQTDNIPATADLEDTDMPASESREDNVPSPANLELSFSNLFKSPEPSESCGTGLSMPDSDSELSVEYLYTRSGPNSSPPLSPTEPAPAKRKSQSRIDELFQPTNKIRTPARAPRRVESDSESDTLDQIQPEKRGPSQEDEDSSDASDVIAPRTRRQRLLPTSSSRTPRVARQSSRQTDVDSDEDLSEEVRDITSSARKTSVSDRLRDLQSGNKRKSKFQKELDSLLKRKRGVQEEMEQEEEDDKPLYDSSSEVESVRSEDFVVDDEDDGDPEALLEIPPEFTSASYQGTQRNFKVVVQAEVYAELHPAYHNLDYGMAICLSNSNSRPR